MSKGFGITPSASNVTMSANALAPESTYLKVLNGPGAGREFRVSKVLNTVGRNDIPAHTVDIDLEPCELPPLPFKVSRRHAEFVWENGILMVRDLGSLNGTFVNGTLVGSRAVQQAAPVALKKGDRISFANIDMEVF